MNHVRGMVDRWIKEWCSMNHPRNSMNHIKGMVFDESCPTNGPRWIMSWEWYSMNHVRGIVLEESLSARNGVRWIMEWLEESYLRNGEWMIEEWWSMNRVKEWCSMNHVRGMVFDQSCPRNDARWIMSEEWCSMNHVRGMVFDESCLRNGAQWIWFEEWCSMNRLAYARGMVFDESCMFEEWCSINHWILLNIVSKYILQAFTFMNKNNGVYNRRTCARKPDFEMNEWSVYDESNQDDAQRVEELHLRIRYQRDKDQEDGRQESEDWNYQRDLECDKVYSTHEMECENKSSVITFCESCNFLHLQIVITNSKVRPVLWIITIKFYLKLFHFNHKPTWGIEIYRHHPEKKTFEHQCFWLLR